MVAGFISERWPASNRNPGRLHVGTPGRIKSESAPDPGYSLNLPLDDDSWRGPVDNSPPGADTAIGDAVRPTVNRLARPADILPMPAGVRSVSRVPPPYTPESHVGAPGGAVTVTGR